MPSNNERITEGLKQVADLPAANLISEEDVKNKVILPMLRALGYEDSDFNYEGRTGRGYVDVVVEHFPSGIVVEAKAPRRLLDQYKEQLEGYVFHKHSKERTTLAILSDGECFNFYAVIGPFWRGGLDEHLVMSFSRGDLRNPFRVGELIDLLGRESNEKGMILDAIASYKQKRNERLAQIEAELTKLNEQRQRINARIQELEAEHVAIVGPEIPATVSSNKPILGDITRYPAASHILRLLREREAYSKTQALDRKWLDSQLVHKVDGVETHQAVSFGLIALEKSGHIDYEGKPIRKVWLKHKGLAI